LHGNRLVNDRFVAPAEARTRGEHPIEEFDVYTLSGKKYHKSGMPELVKWLADRKKPWRALVSRDGKPIDPYYRQFASEGTLVLVRKTKPVPKATRATVPKSARKPAAISATRVSKLPSQPYSRV